MTFSPVICVRPRSASLVKLVKRHSSAARSLAARFASRRAIGKATTAPGSDARLGDGGTSSLIVGHAHGAQILEPH